MKKLLCVALSALMLVALASCAMAATGVGSVTSVSTTAATEAAAGSVSVNTTICAVTLDENGVIVGISFDAVQPKGSFDAAGAVVGDAASEPQSKKELQEGYGMLKASAIGKEWYEQMDALEQWCIGKTVAEVLGMPTFDRGDGHHNCVPDDADLKTGCTISIGDQLKALEKAAACAK